MSRAGAVRRAFVDVVELLDALDEADQRFARDLMTGLSCAQKEVPSRYFYDRQGSELFEQITGLPEYYPTRAEMEILKDNCADIARGIGKRTLLVEFGSGSSRKTEILLAALGDVAAYVPIDVSSDALQEACARLRRRFVDLDVVPVVGDFTTMDVLQPLGVEGTRTGFFPGSTIGNFSPDDARALLARLGRLLGRGSKLVVGADLVKDREVLVRAYDDAAGVTARFNLNLLAHANRRFGEIFDLDAFGHRAVYNEEKSRIEMHLVSKRAQSVTMFGHTFHFAKGETVRTELSHKYTVASFQRLAAEAGWHWNRAWFDKARLFSVHELTLAGA